MTTFLHAHHLRVRATATGPLELHEHTGASLRGAFFGALWGRFCVNKDAPTCVACPLLQACPVSSLVAPLRDEAVRGRDVPRPYAIRPPVSHARALGPGDGFAFGLTIFGQRLELFPYVAMALHEMGRHGIGRRVPQNAWERGRFVIEQVDALNALTGKAHTVQQVGSQRIAVPDLPTTWNDAVACAAPLPQDQVTLRFLTPLRLIDQKQLVKRPVLRPLVQRLLERHDALAQEYGGRPFDVDTRTTLIAAADAIRLVHDRTRWVNLDSYSRRQRHTTPIGGLLGEATYAGDLTTLLPLIIWGTVLQVGKDTVKGNGVYELVHG